MMNHSNPILLVVHFLWAVWMVAGVVLAVLGFRFRVFWRFRVLRTAHLIGLLATATVPLWNQGICPLTEWEWQGEAAAGAANGESFIIRLLHDILYLDVSPTVLSVTIARGAVVTLGIYVWHPPWRSVPGRRPT